MGCVLADSSEVAIFLGSVPQLMMELEPDKAKELARIAKDFICGAQDVVKRPVMKLQE